MIRLKKNNLLLSISSLVVFCFVIIFTLPTVKAITFSDETLTAIESAGSATDTTTACGTSSSVAGTELFGYDDIYCGLPLSNLNSFFKTKSIGDLPEIIATNILPIITTIVAILALLGLVISGIMFITAGGEAEKAKAARNNIVWIITGIIIYLLAFWFLGALQGIGVNDLNLSKQRVDKVTKENAAGSIKKFQQAPTTVSQGSKFATIYLFNNTAYPSTLCVKPGVKVLWHNYDDTPYELASDPSVTNIINIPPHQVLPESSSEEYAMIQTGELTYTYQKLDQISEPVTAKIIIRQNCPLGAIELNKEVVTNKAKITVREDGFSSKVHLVPLGSSVTWKNDTLSKFITLLRLDVNDPKGTSHFEMDYGAEREEEMKESGAFYYTLEGSVPDPITGIVPGVLIVVN